MPNDEDLHDAAMWRKHKHLFALAYAVLEAASPLVLNKLKFQEAMEDAATKEQRS